MIRPERRSPAILILLLLVAVGVAPAVAADLTEAEALERFFIEPGIEKDWFAPSFLNAVPFSQLEPIRDQLTAGLGGLVEIRKESDRYLAVFQKGSIPAFVTLDDQGRFVGLRFLNPVRTVDDLDAAIREVRNLPGEAALLVLKNGEELAAVRGDQPLAVGSAFKLAILVALRNQIEAGERNWYDVVALQPRWKSLPSGLLQTWPSETQLTLQTLATLMISVSDNTATDALLAIVGRDAVEMVSRRNRPFLGTREAFQLKSPDAGSLRKRFLKEDLDKKRQVLEELRARELPGVEIFGKDPVYPEIEWFFTARELCTLMEQVADLDLMGVNPGVADADSWDKVAYKGGSEPGIMNLTTWVRAKDGTEFCVCITQNNRKKALDETRLTGFASGILGALAKP